MLGYAIIMYNCYKTNNKTKYIVKKYNITYIKYIYIFQTKWITKCMKYVNENDNMYKNCIMYR